MVSGGYVKLYGDELFGSWVWAQSPEVCKVWVTLMGMADMNGVVDSTVYGIAGIARLPVEVIEEAIAMFMKPNKHSRSQREEGRMIVEHERGWTLVNLADKRDRQTEKQRKDAERKRKWRERTQRDVTGTSEGVTGTSQPTTTATTTTDLSTRPNGRECVTPVTPVVAKPPRRPSPIPGLWSWYQDALIAAGFRRKALKLTPTHNRAVARVLQHIGKALDVDVDAAVESQKAHVAYRIEEALRDASGEKKGWLRNGAAWRVSGRNGGECWWDWWHSNVVDAGEGPQQKTFEEIEEELRREGAI